MARAKYTQKYIDNKVVNDKRIADLETERESTGIRNLTVEQAHDKIDQIFNGATTVAGLRTATVVALKEIIPFVI